MHTRSSASSNRLGLGQRGVSAVRLLTAMVGLSAAALPSGCRPDGGLDAVDMAMPADLATPVSTAKDVTIRDINSPMSSIKDKDRVRFTGVVISPRNWITTDTKNGNWCYYRVMVMQADGSPTTIRDGLAITLSLKTTFTDLGPITDCIALAKTDEVATAMTDAKRGDSLQIDGKMAHYGSGATATRQIDVYKGVIKNNGAAAMMPVPFEADPLTYVQQQTGLAQAFTDAQGVLVTFKNVQVNSPDMKYQDFSVSTTPMGGARMAANFLRVTEPMFMAPAAGSMLTSVTGIVTGDFKGTIWPRDAADIVK